MPSIKFLFLFHYFPMFHNTKQISAKFNLMIAKKVNTHGDWHVIKIIREQQQHSTPFTFIRYQIVN